MDRIKFKFDGRLEGGFPLEEEDIEIITKLDFYDQLIDFIEEGNEKEALNLANQNLEAEFIIENIPSLEDEGFECLEVKNIFVEFPYIEEINGIKIPLFKYFGASFILEGPKDVISDWMDKQDNIYKFNQELLEEWFEERGEFLQDGCSYFFGGACYDLAGFGEHGCNIDPESIEKAFN